MREAQTCEAVIMTITRGQVATASSSIQSGWLLEKDAGSNSVCSFKNLLSTGAETHREMAAATQQYRSASLLWALTHWRRNSPRAVKTAVFALPWDRDQCFQCCHTPTRHTEAPSQTSSSSKQHTQEQQMCSAPKRQDMRRTYCSLNTRAVAQSSCCN